MRLPTALRLSLKMDGPTLSERGARTWPPPTEALWSCYLSVGLGLIR
jgi:hypothetical protein